MEVKLIDSTTDPLFLISYAARKCYNSLDKDVLSKRAEFVKGLIKAGHETPLEFANATFEINGISISCQNQMVRHRHASFCVQSGRYVDQRNNDCVLPYELLAQYEGAEDYVKEAKELLISEVENITDPEESVRKDLEEICRLKISKKVRNILHTLYADLFCRHYPNFGIQFRCGDFALCG